MKFSKGQIVKVKFEKTTDAHRGYTKTITGEYEVVRTGVRMYLFNPATGHDWTPTKEALIEAINNAKE